MSKPRIVVCTTAYHPFIGGAEIAIQEVAKRLSAEFDFFILTARMRRSLPRREIRPEGVVIRLGFGTRFDKWLLPFTALFYIFWNLEFGSEANCFASDGRSPGICRGGKFWNLAKPKGFALWGMDIGQGALAAAGIKFLYPRLPFVLTVQYGESEARLREGRAGFIARAFRLMLGQADAVTVISRYLLAYTRDSGYCGPAVVIPNGADIAKFHIPNRKSHANSKTVITVSRLVPKNGIDILIRAIAEVKKTIPDVRCLIIGAGTERSALESEVARYTLQANVEFLGEIPHPDLPNYLHEADLFVRPSRSEGMGNAFVEALAAGLPIIGTPVGGIADIIEDGKTGLFVRPDDPQDLAEKIARLLGNTELAAALARAGRAKVEKEFSWDAIAGRYGVVFEEALDAKKRVVIATGLFPPEIGGPATYSSVLAEELPERGIGLRVVPFRAVRHLPKLIRHLSYAGKLVFASRGADVIFAQDPVSVGLPAYCASRMARKKFYLKIVGDYAWEQYQQKVQSSKFKVQNDGPGFKTIEEFQDEKFDFVTEGRRLIQKFVARRAERVIVPSRYLKGIVSQWGVSPEKIEVIYNAFLSPRAPARKDEARRRLQIPPDSFAIVSVGRLVPWKGFDALIAALSAVRREIPSARLYIVGAGPEILELDAAIRAAGLEDAAVLTGGLPHEETLDYLRAGDLFILNSSYEGFSHTLLEAMSMEIPVMATAVGGNGEAITDGVQGVLYAARDSEAIAGMVIDLARDAARRLRLAKAAYEGLGRFGKEEMIRKTADILSAV